MDENPYAAPAAELESRTEVIGRELSDALIAPLARTKPWVRVVGVFLWIGVAILLLGGIAVLFAGTYTALDGGTAGSATKAPFSGSMMVGFAVLYIVLAALYIYPARQIWSYGSLIDRAVRSRSVSDVAAALEAQRSFWAFVGVGFLLIAGIYVLVLIGSAFFGLMSAASGH